MSSLVSELILRLKDDVSPGAKSIQAALNKVAESEKTVGKQSAELKKLVSELDRLKNATNAVDSFNKQRKALADARTAFSAARDNVKKLATEITAVDKPTRAMSTAFKAAQREVKAAAEAFKLQSAAVSAARTGLSEFGIAANQAASAEGKLRSAIEQTASALKRQSEAEAAALGRQKQMAERRAALRESISSIVPFAGPAILHETAQALNAGATYEQRIAQMKAAGLGPAEIAEAEDVANDTTKRFPGLKKEDMLQSYKEARSVMQEAHEAAMAARVIGEAKAALLATNNVFEAGEVGKLVKSAELLGRTKNEELFRAYINSQVKAGQTMDGTITPEGQYEVAKFARNAGARLSDRFMSTTAQSLVQEVGGSTAGTLIRDFYQHVIGGHMTHQGYKNLLAAGLIDPKDALKTKTGEIKGLKPGKHLADYQLAMTDPDKWIYNVDDKLKKKGMSEEQRQAWWSSSFDSGTADLAVKLTTQRKAFENHAELYDKAMGLDAWKLSAENMNAATGALKAAIENFTSTLTKDTTKRIAQGESIGTTGVNAVTKFLEDHPTFTSIASPIATLASLAAGGTLSAKALIGAGRFLSGAPAAATTVTAGAATKAAAATVAGDGALTWAGRLGGNALTTLGVTARILGRGAGIVGAGLTAYDFASWLAAGVTPRTGLTEATAPDPLRDMYRRTHDPVLLDALIIRRKTHGQSVDWMRGGERPDWAEDHFNHAPRQSIAPAVEGISETTDAGAKAGQNIAEGLAGQTSAIASVARSILDAIRKELAGGVEVPIRIQRQGMSAIGGIHADVGISHELSE